jgi:endonuclease/exonuclease/phosphatase family metal-dependent hydrolase
VDGSVQQGATLVMEPDVDAPPTAQPRTPAVKRDRGPQIQRGGVIRPQEGPDLVKTSTGRDGTGFALAPLTAVDAPVGTTVKGQVRIAVANLPNRTSAGGFASSLRSLTADGADFVTLNEVSGRSIDTIRAGAPGYDAYRDPVPDRSTGGSQSMNNVVMWRMDRWNLIDGGRLKVVDDDTGIHGGQRFVWDRYATWAMLQRKEDGAIVSVLSLHMPTNPAKFPAQPAGASMSRVERYSRGMDVLVGSVRALAEHGPVLVGGDMNSHHSQGAWTAAAKMTAAGYDYVKDRGVMHLFFQDAVDVVSNRQIGVASDHPAIVTTLDMRGIGPS